MTDAWKPNFIGVDPLPEGDGDVLTQSVDGHLFLRSASYVRSYPKQVICWYELPPIQRPPKVLDVEKAGALLRELGAMCGDASSGLDRHWLKKQLDACWKDAT